MKLYSVVFKNNGKNYYFNGEDDLNIKDYVILETEKGLQYGQINNIVSENYDLFLTERLNTFVKNFRSFGIEIILSETGGDDTDVLDDDNVI